MPPGYPGTMLANANHRAQSPAACKRHFYPRRQIAIEVAAGWLWLSLRLPADITRYEIEAFVGPLLGRIAGGASEAEVAAELINLQTQQLCEAVNFPALRRLAGDLMRLMRQY